MALSVLACAVAFQRRLTGLGWVGRRLLTTGVAEANCGLAIGKRWEEVSL